MSLAHDNAVAWIGGRAVTGESTFAVVSPSTQQPIAEATDADDAMIQRAIDAAQGALSAWASTPETQRADHLDAWAEVIAANTDDIAELVSQEGGKIVREARGEVGAGVAALHWSADRARELAPHELASPTPTRRHFTTATPVGVVACITPWNFPIAAVLVKAAAAAAAGCTVVIKPSEETPLVATYLARLATQSGVPDGVINVVSTAEPARFGDAIAARDDVRALSFTGSTRVGQRLYAQCGASIKRLSLELGGNAPFVVFADADVELAATDAVNARFYNSGQICVGANRFFVHADIYDAFADAFVANVADLTVGAVNDDTTDIGPLINRQAKQRVNRLIADAVDKGATVAFGGVSPGDDLFVAPTVVADATTEMDAYTTEIFGPTAFLYRFDDAADVVSLANDTPAGLAAYAYSRDVAMLGELATRLEAGVVGLNTTQIFASELPFGGIKQSGIGREWGHNCLDDFLDVRSVAFEIGTDRATS